MLTNFEKSMTDTEKIRPWEYVSGLINGNIELKQEFEEVEYLSSLNKDITKFIATQEISDELSNRRNGIIKHLKKVLSNKFRGSKLTPFGSFESGLSLSNGDIDLCLQFHGERPKKVLTKIARMLREDAMENVTLISSAKVPIVKFVDTKSRIPVDISINNNLAVYNTELLRRYVAKDERVRPFILAIKKWALNRGISNAVHGTFSSYAWTLIAINYLQTLDQPILPNLKKNDGTETVSIEGSTFDTGLFGDSELTHLPTNNSKSTELIVGFFKYLAIEWPWDEHVISVGNGGLIKRTGKNWVHKKPLIHESIMDEEIKRLGKHSLPVEDPFDNDHDLSRVLDAEGVFSIRDEVIRAWILICQKSNWEQIVEIKYPELVPDSPKLDLFEDLRDKTDEEIKTSLQSLFAKLDTIEKDIEIREFERKESIKMSKALRKNAELSREQTNLSSQLRPRRSEINEMQSKRDSANNHYIPVHFIEEELVRVYNILIEQADSNKEISLEKEKYLFSWFFELQSMHEHSQKTRQYHREFVQLLNQQKQSIEHIKNIREEMINVSSFGKSTDFDELANRLLRELNPLRKDRRNIRREIGRLEAWLRKQNYVSKNHKRNKPHNRNRRNDKRKVDDVKSKVISGDSFSLEELGMLLKHGGINSVGKAPKSQQHSSKTKKKGKQFASPHRGKRGKSRKNRD